MHCCHCILVSSNLQILVIACYSIHLRRKRWRCHLIACIYIIASIGSLPCDWNVRVWLKNTSTEANYPHFRKITKHMISIVFTCQMTLVIFSFFRLEVAVWFKNENSNFETIFNKNSRFLTAISTKDTSRYTILVKLNFILVDKFYFILWFYFIKFNI